MRFSVTAYLLFLIVTVSSLNVQAQNEVIDSLRTLLKKEQNDSARARLMIFMGNVYRYSISKTDSAWMYFRKAVDINRKLKSPQLQILIGNSIAGLYNATGNYPEALKLALETLRLAEQIHDTSHIFFTKREIMWTYRRIGDHQKELALAKDLHDFAVSGYFKDPKTVKIYQQMAYNNLASAYQNLNISDSALRYRQLVYNTAKQNGDKQGLALGTMGLAALYADMGNTDSSLYYSRLNILYGAAVRRSDLVRTGQIHLARAFEKKGQMDSAFFYTYKTLNEFKNVQDTAGIMNAALLLSDFYKSRNQFDSAYTYLSYYTDLSNKSQADEKSRKVQDLTFNEILQQERTEQERKEAQQRYESKLKIYGLLTGLGVALLIAAILYRNNKQKQKAKQKIEEAYEELKLTQSQLVQREKMASLGELTAGIAHEIQNPMNFVNNFSDVNSELIAELKSELQSGNTDKAISIATNIEENEQKISQHGKRADAIVKGMLQHSRVSTGEKQPSDINALAEEYLRLTYHGIRAKNKEFNVQLQIDCDQSLGKVNVVPQDIGRVLLNLYNNAFYAVQQKKQQLNGAYEPKVSVGTKKANNKVEIHVKDNGTGIPKKALDKIFQPFFTTKPTGEGTGLGLSLSYDIITKGHGGELKVNTKEGEGTEFIIQLPVA